MSDELVTVATCAQAFEAEVIRGRLESAGIEAYVQAMGWKGVYFGSSFGGVGGISVQVPETDADLARDILKDTAELPEDELLTPACPRCGGRDVTAKDVSSGFLAFVLDLFPRSTPEPTVQHHCNGCGHEWPE